MSEYCPRCETELENFECPECGYEGKGELGALSNRGCCGCGHKFMQLRNTNVRKININGFSFDFTECKNCGYQHIMILLATDVSPDEVFEEEKSLEQVVKDLGLEEIASAVRDFREKEQSTFPQKSRNQDNGGG